jgi:hypothetical protein
MRGIALVAAVSLLLPACYATRAARQSKRIVSAGFDFEDHGPWVLVTAPGSLLLAAGNLAVGSLLPLGGGVDPREPEHKWFHAYPGAMLPGEQVAILCHRERATWVTAIRSQPGGAWQDARYEKWHFPVCIEVLPGSYELQVHYFAREHEDDQQESVTRQAESTAPSVLRWEAEAGQVYLLSAYLGDAKPSQATPPQRHIPRSRSLGTTWWGLEESEWYVRLERTAAWQALEGPVVERRRDWARYEASRR